MCGVVRTHLHVYHNPSKTKQSPSLYITGCVDHTPKRNELHDDSGISEDGVDSHEVYYDSSNSQCMPVGGTDVGPVILHVLCLVRHIRGEFGGVPV